MHATMDDARHGSDPVLGDVDESRLGVSDQVVRRLDQGSVPIICSSLMNWVGSLVIVRKELLLRCFRNRHPNFGSLTRRSHDDKRFSQE